MLAVIQKSNHVSSLQGQLIATQDRSLRAERPSDELGAPTAMPNRQVQQLSQESAAHAAAAIRVVRKNSIRHHAASFSKPYSWCSPPRIALEVTR